MRIATQVVSLNFAEPAAVFRVHRGLTRLVGLCEGFCRKSGHQLTTRNRLVLAPLALLLCGIAQVNAGMITVNPYFSTQTIQNTDGSFAFGPSPLLTGNPISANHFAAQGELMFDISTIPVGSTITSAVLNFTVASVASVSSQAEILAFTGSLGAGDLSPSLGLLLQFGLNRLFVPQAPDQYRQVQPGSIGNFFVVTDVIQDLVSGGEFSAGFVLTSANGGADAFSFYGREASNPSLRPTLAIAFDEPVSAVPEPSSVALLSIGLACLLSGRLRRQKQTNMSP